VDLGFEDQPFGVHQKVSLSASDLLVPVVSSLFASYPGGLGRLPIRYPRAGVWVPPQTDPQPLAQNAAALICSKIPARCHYWRK
jgi:hypothetical protein